MRSVLIVKTSSLGDLVHALPAVTDLAGAYPGIAIDWVAEEAFAGLPTLHAAVRRVIPCAVRRWRKSWWTAETRAAIAGFRRAVTAEAYDLVLDLQGLIKSAWLARQARGPRAGYRWGSAREPLASLAYHRRYAVAWGQHAIQRNRQLTASACGYTLPAALDYGLRPTAVADATPYVMAFHATSRDDKLWPETAWRALLQWLDAHGVGARLAWGSPTEQERANRLAAGIGRAEVLPRMSLPQLAEQCAGAIGAIGVDSGLTHLAAAAGIPVTALFTTTAPALTGVVGGIAPAENLGGDGLVPAADAVIAAVQRWPAWVAATANR